MIRKVLSIATSIINVARGDFPSLLFHNEQKSCIETLIDNFIYLLSNMVKLIVEFIGYLQLICLATCGLNVSLFFWFKEPAISHISLARASICLMCMILFFRWMSRRWAFPVLISSVLPEIKVTPIFFVIQVA